MHCQSITLPQAYSVSLEAALVYQTETVTRSCAISPQKITAFSAPSNATKSTDTFLNTLQKLKAENILTLSMNIIC